MAPKTIITVPGSWQDLCSYIYTCKILFQSHVVNFSLEPKCLMITTIHSPTDIKPPASSNIHFWHKLLRGITFLGVFSIVFHHHCGYMLYVHMRCVSKCGRMHARASVCHSKQMGVRGQYLRAVSFFLSKWILGSRLKILSVFNGWAISLVQDAHILFAEVE